jgi:hypothetical protein
MGSDKAAAIQFVCYSRENWELLWYDVLGRNQAGIVFCGSLFLAASKKLL